MTPFGKKTLETPESIHEIERLVSIECGKDMKIKYIDSKEEMKNNITTGENTLENLAKNFNLPMDIVEE